MIGRIAVTDVHPVVEGGFYPARATEGELLEVQATVFREGHDLVGATAVLKGPDRYTAQAHLELVSPGIDLFVGHVLVGPPGAYTLVVEGWADPVATWRHGIEVKVEADVDVTLELEEGARVLERAAAGVPKQRRAAVLDAVGRLRDDSQDVHARLVHAEHPSMVDLLADHPLRDLLTRSKRFPIWVDRARATFSAWYELFPRSEGGLAGATARLPAIADMGFDVVYLPPIHPVGTSFRKGPNNTLKAGKNDVGSPWAIGSPAGGHDAIDPGLGGLDDLDALVGTARDLGMEVALDLALQCSPDHPWVTGHPEWFAHRADGSIAYAENPPKKYQDIYPLYFDTDPEGLREEVLRIVRHWISHGIGIFRVDNPHTKPLAFWEWLIAEVKSTDPQVLFLAEAFTRPPMMHTLAKIGFTQSYTYFTWRVTDGDLRDYLTELTSSPTADYMRPNLWPNTPDILPFHLQHQGMPQFKIRALLAATLSPSYGIYSGYELFESLPLAPGREEYLDSEKFQLRPRDWARAEETGQTLAPYLARINAVRKTEPALQRLRGLVFHAADDPAFLAYSRQDPAEPDRAVLCVVNLDPLGVHETLVHLDYEALGWSADTLVTVTDQLGVGDRWTWGMHPFVRLDPSWEPGHLFLAQRL
ncbi:MAG TPA: alpha-1,4-glucan--maltose-1-phosphate maltosyltransferase [Mycobacteriales bacterium]